MTSLRNGEPPPPTANGAAVARRSMAGAKKLSILSMNSCAAFGGSVGTGSGPVAVDEPPLRFTPRVIYVRSERVSHAITLVLLLLSILCVLLLLIGVVFVLSHEPAEPAPTITATSGRVVRLSDDFEPILYELDLHVYLPHRPELDFGVRNFTVAGRLRLRLRCRCASATIQLHALDLTVDFERVRLRPNPETDSDSDSDPIPIKIVDAALDRRTTVLKLIADRPLVKNREYTLEISYLAIIGRPLDGGLFHTAYAAEGGQRRLVAATQMQALDARRLFPCFDQPRFKARFALRVRHPAGLLVVANTPAVGSPRHFDDGWSASEFETTPRMSTYLFAMALIDFPYIETAYKNYSIRVWAQPSKLPHVTYALRVAERSLQYFEDYFRIPYPLAKLDIVALPALRVAAMENWGLIFCQQQSVVYAPDVHSGRNRQYVADVIAHEIAHMWFGNLVTMEWWDDLWLNEGFATIMAMKAADFVENSTARTREHFFEHTVKAFRFDQMPAQAHPLSHPADTMYEIKRRFNRITYLKAAAILRMIEGVVGPALFQRGLQVFLQRFAYGSARADDLLNTLSETVQRYDPDRIKRLPPPAGGQVTARTNLSLVELMHEWIYRAGFPLIVIDNREVGRRNVTAAAQLLTDARPCHRRRADTPTTTGTVTVKRLDFCWKVPLFIDSTSANTTKVLWMLAQNNTIGMSPDEFLDAQSYGYYRLLYQDYGPLTARLHANHRSLDVVSRARLLEDLFTMARIGLVTYETTFRVCEYLINETDYLPLLVFNNHIQMLHLLLRWQHDDTAEQLRMFAVNMMRPAYHKLFIDKLKFSDSGGTLREFLMTQLCHWHYAPCIRGALAEFEGVRRNCTLKILSDASCNKIPPELRVPVYGVGISFGTTADFLFLEEKYAAETYEAERNRMINGFASTRNITLVVYTLTHFISRFHRRPALKDELVDYLHKLSKSSILSEIRDYIRHNFGELSQRIPHPQVLRILLTYVTKWMHTDEDIRELEAFAKRFINDLQKHRMTPYVEELKVEVKSNRQFMQRYAPQIGDYFRSRPEVDNLADHAIS